MTDKHKHLLLFTGDDTADLSVYTSALDGEYILKFCGCPITGAMITREARNEQLDLVVIMLNYTELDMARRIVAVTKREFPGTPVIVIAHKRILESEIRDVVDPEVVIYEKKNLGHVTEFAQAVHNLLGNHAHDETELAAA